MVDYVPIEKGMTIRQPSTANLMIDSLDRDSGFSAGNFSISRNASILNGFFTRIGVTEVVLEWFEPNIQTGIGDTMDITIGSSTSTITLPQGFYTVQRALDVIVTLANTAFSGTTFSIVNSGAVTLNSTQSYIIQPGSLQNRLGFAPTASTTTKTVGATKYPDLRIYKYIDFISNQLTYAQDLKDSSTNLTTRDTLCRWYFAWDIQPATDSYGFPILQGYTGFCARRLFSPPKQIRWEPNLPIGNLAFQVWGYQTKNDNYGEIVDNTQFDWQMTLQVSEV